MLRRNRINLLTLLLLIANIWAAGTLTLLLFLATWGKHSEFMQMLSSVDSFSRLVYVSLLAIHSWPALIWFSVTYSLVLRWALVYWGLRSARAVALMSMFTIVATFSFCAVQYLLYNIAPDAIISASLFIAALLSTIIVLLHPPSTPVARGQSIFAKLCVFLLVTVAAGYVLDLAVKHLLPFPYAVRIVAWSISAAALTAALGLRYDLPQSEIIWVVFGVIGFWLLPPLLGSLGVGLTRLLEYLHHLPQSQQDFVLWRREEVVKALSFSAQHFVGLITGLVAAAVAKRTASNE